jgi:hypothetical protein
MHVVHSPVSLKADDAVASRVKPKPTTTAQTRGTTCPDFSRRRVSSFQPSSTVPVLSDEEIASAEVGGQDVAVIPVVAWNVVCSREGLLGQSSRRSNEAASGRPRRFSNPYDVVVLRPQARWDANAILRSGAVIV